MKHRNHTTNGGIGLAALFCMAVTGGTILAVGALAARLGEAIARLLT